MKLRCEILLVFLCISICFAKEYSAKADDKESQLTEVDDQNADQSIFRNLVRPFRMEKLNLVWIKAQHVSNSIVFNW